MGIRHFRTFAAAALIGFAFAGSAKGAGALERGSASVAAAGMESDKAGIKARQQALLSLSARPGSDADRILLNLFESYREWTLPPALWLELFEAAAKRDNPNLKELLAKREGEIERSTDIVSRFRECLEGGDAAAGRAIFTEKAEAGCIRCHRVSGKGGEIGPDLTSVRQVTDRVFILESIIDPNAVITPGFQNVLLTLKSGETVTGILSFEGADEVTITSIVDGKKRKVKTDDITERTPLPSAMPPGFGVVLGKRAIRDLVEFLATVE
jgi:quinoprotein glucose dehydrogenase